ncbi:MAG: M20/M25/M40 family metallo-hydrolase, partial [Bacteroidales bacterium]|nr:M20/M25/M40 family metallo-hydrolase [Bacteroidales bacterium]
PAADDNGSGVVTLLSLCKYYSENGIKPPKTLVAGFWAAEETTMGTAFNGSKYFVRTFDDLKMVKCYCNLDCFGRKNQGAFFYYSPGYQVVGDIMSCLLLEAGYTILEYSVKENEKRSSDYMSFYAKKIPYFGWNDYDNSGFIHSTDDTVEKISFDKIRSIASLTTKLIEKL